MKSWQKSRAAAREQPHINIPLLDFSFSTTTNTLFIMAGSFLAFVSQLFGWVYTILWSLSFYPQPILNYRRRSTAGTTIDFPAINILGFLAYFISNTAFLFSPRIRAEYAARNHGLTPTVQYNDLAFAAHAVVMATITVSQFIPALWGLDKREKSDPGSRPSKPMLGILAGSFVGVGVVALIVAARHDEDVKTGWASIDVVRYSKNRCFYH